MLFVPAFRVAVFPAPAFLSLRSAPSHRLSQSQPLPCISVPSLFRLRLFLSGLILSLFPVITDSRHAPYFPSFLYFCLGLFLCPRLFPTSCFLPPFFPILDYSCPISFSLSLAVPHVLYFCPQSFLSSTIPVRSHPFPVPGVPHILYFCPQSFPAAVISPHPCPFPGLGRPCVPHPFYLCPGLCLSPCSPCSRLCPLLAFPISHVFRPSIVFPVLRHRAPVTAPRASRRRKYRFSCLTKHELRNIVEKLCKIVVSDIF